MEHPGIFILSILLVMLPTVILVFRHPNISKGQRLEKKAMRRGYTAQAQRIKYEDRSLMGNQRPEREQGKSTLRQAYYVTYQFQVKGKVYYYQETLTTLPPEITTVCYPTGNPNKAFLKGYGPVGTFPIALVFGALLLISVVYNTLVGWLA